ncbi:hypothetical protein KC19_12G042400 [Ceratodon purpureus]|uniref:Uncharacterized protein n=1 Tax=Ceratodon purpureus TaxID=3225 RepID=A0A8T0G987_CERPU|nr:hypothetical protein KC19_12G042400 [Ceratodon purpureus]
MFPSMLLCYYLITSISVQGQCLGYAPLRGAAYNEAVGFCGRSSPPTLVMNHGVGF